MRVSKKESQTKRDKGGWKNYRKQKKESLLFHTIQMESLQNKVKIISRYLNQIIKHITQFYSTWSSYRLLYPVVKLNR